MKMVFTPDPSYFDEDYCTPARSTRRVSGSEKQRNSPQPVSVDDEQVPKPTPETLQVAEGATAEDVSITAPHESETNTPLPSLSALIQSVDLQEDKTESTSGDLEERTEPTSRDLSPEKKREYTSESPW